MEILFALILTATLTIFGSFFDDLTFKKVSNYSGILFLITLIGLIFWIAIERKVEVINVTVVENTETGVIMSGYFSDSTTFNIVPNHIIQIKATHPRWGSLDDIKFEY